MGLNSKHKSATLGARVKVTEWIATRGEIELIRSSLVAEFSAVSPNLDVKALTKSEKEGKPPILEVAIERSGEGALVSVTQNEKPPDSPGHIFLMVVGVIVLGGIAPWAVVIAVPAIFYWKFKQAKNAPFSGEQIALCLKNLKTHVEHRGAQIAEIVPLQTAPESRQKRLEALTSDDALVSWLLLHDKEVVATLNESNGEPTHAQLLNISGVTPRWANWIERNMDEVLGGLAQETTDARTTYSV
jgi:hypothetical protein